MDTAGNKCYRAEERITEPDCQGEEGRAGNNRQSKKETEKKNNKIDACMRRHTSASLTINENADPTVRTDMEAAFNRLAPESWNDEFFEHTCVSPGAVVGRGRRNHHHLLPHCLCYHIWCLLLFHTLYMRRHQ